MVMLAFLLRSTMQSSCACRRRLLRPRPSFSFSSSSSLSSSAAAAASSASSSAFHLLPSSSRNINKRTLTADSSSSSTTWSPGSAPSLIDLSQATPSFDASSVYVFSDVITEEEEHRLVEELEGNVKRRRYVSDHWDSVIEHYKEIEKRQWQNPLNAELASRIRALIVKTLGKPRDLPFLPVHVIDLGKDGFIKPHVDSVKFSGDIVSGLSLLSPAIMQLRKSDHAEEQEGKKDETPPSSPPSIVRLLLPPRSLYILHGEARYQYAHEILPPCVKDETWVDRTKVMRERRLSLIFRDEKESKER